MLCPLCGAELGWTCYGVRPGDIGRAYCSGHMAQMHPPEKSLCFYQGKVRRIDGNTVELIDNESKSQT